MQMKSGKYLADWRDAKGIRHRKAFPTTREAREYQKQQQARARSLKNPSARTRR